MSDDNDFGLPTPNRIFAEGLGEAIIARDWVGVHARLAPWLADASDPSMVQAFFEGQYKRVLADFGIDELHYPEVYNLGWNRSNLAGLREKKSRMPRPAPIPKEVTEANFRQWMKMELCCSELQVEKLQFDVFAVPWFMVVETESGLRVGYWTHDPYDCSEKCWPFKVGAGT